MQEGDTLVKNEIVHNCIVAHMHIKYLFGRSRENNAAPSWLRVCPIYVVPLAHSDSVVETNIKRKPLVYSHRRIQITNTHVLIEPKVHKLKKPYDCIYILCRIREITDLIKSVMIQTISIRQQRRCRIRNLGHMATGSYEQGNTSDCRSHAIRPCGHRIRESENFTNSTETYVRRMLCYTVT
jgi:hypothetical protein